GSAAERRDVGGPGGRTALAVRVLRALAARRMTEPRPQPPRRAGAAPAPGLQFEVVRADAGGARAGVLRTNGHVVHTPAFMPVGTHGAVNAVTPAILEEHGVEIIVSNALRLSEQPGRSVLRGYDGLGAF